MTTRRQTANDDTLFWTLKVLQENPGVTQRTLAKEVGINVSTINFCLKALVEKGWIKMGNFSKNPDKLSYLYPLRMTPHKLIATDLVHAIALATVAGLGHLLAGLVDGTMLLSLLMSSIPTVIIGSMLATRLEARRLQIILATALLIIGLKVLSH